MQSVDEAYRGPTSSGPVYEGPAYEGPPKTAPPPTGWSVPHVVESAPPRRLPPQDHAAIDDAEARARVFTLGMGAVAGALILIALCALAGHLF